MSDKTSAQLMAEWLREAAQELENAHGVLDGLGHFPRINPDTGVELTLAARISLGVDNLVDAYQ